MSIAKNYKEEAEKAFHSRQWASCIENFQSYFASNPADPISLLYVARACTETGQNDTAVQYYEMAEKIIPDHATPFTRKTCLLFEQYFDKLVQPKSDFLKDQISMRSLGHKGRFGNQIFQYAYLRNYALKFGLEVGTGIWPGSYMFDLSDPPPRTAPEMVKERSTDMLGALKAEASSLHNRDVTGYFQFDTNHWSEFRALYQSIFQPAGAFLNAVSEPINKAFSGYKSILAFHLRRGDFLTNDKFDVAPSIWYQEWLTANWHKLDSPLLYIATDESEILRDFSDYSPISCNDICSNYGGLEFSIDWTVLHKANVLCTSNSSFSISAALANKNAMGFFRPDFSEGRLIQYNPWNSKILDWH